MFLHSAPLVEPAGRSLSLGEGEQKCSRMPQACPRLMRKKKVDEGGIYDFRMFQKGDMRGIVHGQKLSARDRGQDFAAGLEGDITIGFAPDQEDGCRSLADAGEVFRPVRRKIIAQRRKNRAAKSFESHLRAEAIRPIGKAVGMHEIVPLGVRKAGSEVDGHCIFAEERYFEFRGNPLPVRESRVEKRQSPDAIGMAAGKRGENRPAHGCASQIEAAGNVERVEQLEQLPVEEIGVVLDVGAVGEAAAEQVVAENAESRGAERFERSRPEIVGNGESVDENHCPAIFGPGEFVMNIACGGFYEIAGRGLANFAVDFGDLEIVAGEVEGNAREDRQQNSRDDLQPTLQSTSLPMYISLTSER